nr:MAG TPA: hypothetical protein [Caudoviricetes sp.]
MAKKSEKDKSIELFHSVVARMGVDVLYEYNRMWLIQLEEYRCIIIPDNTLYDELMADVAFKEKIKPCDIENSRLFSYTNATNWIPLDVSEEHFKGKEFSIIIDGFSYDIPLNKDLMMVKLRKSEFTDISYQVYKEKHLVLGIKKRFDSEYGFDMIRLFQIV